ncbi:hypothetical protein D9M68_807540 [compost metagenome]
MRSAWAVTRGTIFSLHFPVDGIQHAFFKLVIQIRHLLRTGLFFAYFSDRGVTVRIFVLLPVGVQLIFQALIFNVFGNIGYIFL